MKYKYSIVGVGKMGSALLNGILKDKSDDKSEILLTVHGDKQKKEYTDLGFNATTDLKEGLSDASFIILSLKPQVVKSLEIFDEIDFTGKCVISVAAGLTVDYLSGRFKNAEIVMCMPNTPALIGEGVTTICAKNKASKNYEIAKKILSSVGKVYEIDERLMDATVPLNGSMPAYALYFANGFIDYAVKSGVDEKTAKLLVLESIISSAKLALSSVLINNVCSKGGTTIAGLDRLISGKVAESIYDCASACAERSEELSK